ncbi:MAG TPA: cytochrome P450 [Mycobacteriales bacterium]|nr:cytochrome P450 [Mycobacteriales bacterium]
MSDNPRPHLDLLDGESYVSGTYERYAWFREHEPVAWDSINELWGVYRYDDITEIETRDDIFVSSDKVKGGYRPNIPADPAIIGLDNPLHMKRRKLVSRRFTPRAVAAREAHVREVVTELLDAALEKRRVEIVGDIASVLPARMIGWLLGFPDEDWPKLRDWSERTIALGGGPRYFDQDGVDAAGELFAASAELYAEKTRCPAEDTMTTWTTAEIDGERLGVSEIASDCLLLLDGGAETTRTVLARTILALIQHPDQWDLLREGADLAVATEEFIRYVTPVHNMCRVAREDYEIGGVTIKAGQQVVLLYSSANRDHAHFTDPEAFDVRRTPNNHIAFGLGTHFCLGAGLARLEIRVFFEELVRRVSSLALAADHPIVEMPNAFVFGLREATVDLTPA